jgi:plasmid stabilization system protein ParE
MKLIVRERADQDLDAIFDWIARDNPRSPKDAALTQEAIL